MGNSQHFRCAKGFRRFLKLQAETEPRKSSDPWQAECGRTASPSVVGIQPGVRGGAHFHHNLKGMKANYLPAKVNRIAKSPARLPPYNVEGTTRGPGARGRAGPRADSSSNPPPPPPVVPSAWADQGRGHRPS